MAVETKTQITKTTRTTLVIDELEVMRIIRTSLDIHIPESVYFRMDDQADEITIWWDEVEETSCLT